MESDSLSNALNPVENRRQLASCFLLSVSAIGDEIVAEIEKRYSMGEYRTDSDFQLSMEEPYELYCEYVVGWNYDEDPKYASRSCYCLTLDLRGYFWDDDERIEPQISMKALEDYVLDKLNQNDH